MAEAETEADQNQDPPKNSIGALTGYKAYNPNKIVGSLLQARQCDCTTKTETNWEHVDKVVRQFKFVDNNPFGKGQNKSWTTVIPDNSVIVREGDLSSNEDEKIQLKSCIPAVYLAGSYEELGFSREGSEKPCDKLECSKCKKKVDSFENYSWKPSLSSTDYRLFLNTNMPDFDKVCTNLIKLRGCRAYACCCSYLSVEKLTTLNSHPEISHWICGQHSVVVVDKNKL